MRKIVRSLILGVVAATLWLPGSAIAETIMSTYMPTIGVPTTDVWYFGWNPVVPPTTPSELANLGVLNFGLAMYEVGGKLQFTFVNGATDPTTASIITEVYFDDRATNDIGVYFNTPVLVGDSGGGVNMVAGPSGNLPEAEPLTPDFDANDSLSWHRVNRGGSHNGVDSIPEWMTVNYSYVDPVGAAPAFNFGDIVNALDSGNLRIAMKVQGIGADGTYSGWSESVIWTLASDVAPPPPGPYAPVPVPAAAGLGFLGMALVGVVRRKKS